MTPFALWYDRYRLVLDLCGVVVASVIGVACVELCWSGSGFSNSLYGNRQAIYSAVISTAASMLGFVLATVSIIVGYIQMPRFKKLRDSDHHDTLYEVYFSAVYALALLTVFGFVGLFVDQDANPRRYVTYCVFFLSFLCTVRIIRCVQVLKRVTKLAGKASE